MFGGCMFSLSGILASAHSSLIGWLLPLSSLLYSDIVEITSKIEALNAIQTIRGGSTQVARG
jgi:hypothetical protein